MTKAQQRKTSSLGADTITILKLQYELAFGLAEADENFQHDIGKYFPPEIIANPEAVKQVSELLVTKWQSASKKSRETVSGEERDMERTKEEREAGGQTRHENFTPKRPREDEEMVEETAAKKSWCVKKLKPNSLSTVLEDVSEECRRSFDQHKRDLQQQKTFRTNEGQNILTPYFLSSKIGLSHVLEEIVTHLEYILNIDKDRVEELLGQAEPHSVSELTGKEASLLELIRTQFRTLRKLHQDQSEVLKLYMHAEYTPGGNWNEVQKILNHRSFQSLGYDVNNTELKQEIKAVRENSKGGARENKNRGGRGNRDDNDRKHNGGPRGGGYHGGYRSYSTWRSQSNQPNYGPRSWQYSDRSRQSRWTPREQPRDDARQRGAAAGK